MTKHNSNNAKSNLAIRRLAVLVCLIKFSNPSFPAELNTAIPDSELSGRPITLELPSQPLGVSLKQFSELSGIDLSFDSNLTKNISAPAVKGRMTRKEALQKLLSGSGLSGAIEGDSAIIKKAPAEKPASLQLDQVQVRA